MAELEPFLEDAIAYVETALADHTDRHGNSPAGIVIAALRRAKAERDAMARATPEETRAALEIAGNTLVAISKLAEAAIIRLPLTQAEKEIEK